MLTDTVSGDGRVFGQSWSEAAAGHDFRVGPRTE